MTQPCFCEPGAMSQCIAENYAQQQSCVGFEKSRVANRCMNRNENMNNHCWSTMAQDIGLHYGVPVADETKVDVADEILPAITPSCINCMRYACTYINMKMSGIQLTLDDLRTEAHNCQGYEYDNEKEGVE